MSKEISHPLLIKFATFKFILFAALPNLVNSDFFRQPPHSCMFWFGEAFYVSWGLNLGLELSI
jgi:hypothetical protein